MLNRVLASCLLAASGFVLWADPAKAQQPTPPEHYTLDARGVDMVTGRFTRTEVDLTIGPEGQGQLVHGRVWANSGWRDILSGTIGISGSTYTVSVGAVSEAFTLSGGDFSSVSNNGSTLTASASGYIFTASDGTVAEFSTAFGSPETSYQASNAVLISVTAPNGDVTTFNWRDVDYCRVREHGTGICTQPASAARINSIGNNRGYQINFTYAENNLPDGANPALQWLRRTGAVAINLADVYCDPAGTGCPGLDPSWPSVAYASTGGFGNRLTSVTDELGRQTNYGYYAPGQGAGVFLSSIKEPGQSAAQVAVTYDGNNRVQSVADATGTWNYTYTNVGNTRTTVATGLSGEMTTAVSDLSIGRATSVTQAVEPSVNRTTSYTYDRGRLKTVTQQEGNRVELFYDDRGNVVRTVASGKYGPGPNDIVTTAEYPNDNTPGARECTTPPITPKTCNKPSQTTDALDRDTNYTYDPATGLVTSIQAPDLDPTSGVNRPTVDFAYVNRRARYYTAPGVLTQGSLISMLDKTSSCATGSSCPPASADESVVEFYYETNTAPNNIGLVRTRRMAGNATSISNERYVYNEVGDLIEVDGPLNNAGDEAADTTYFRYDGIRRLVGTITPAADPASSPVRRAVRYIYGDPTTSVPVRVDTQQVGSVTGVNDTAWAGFTALQTSVTVYDSLQRPIINRFEAGGQIVNLSQTEYDLSGRVKCVAQRMNPLYFSTPNTAACTSATEEGFWPDRIATYSYNRASQELSVSQNGIAESVSYTPNGAVATVTDGQNNVSRTLYDEFDRPYRFCYPGSANCAAPTGPFEQLTYDAGSNVIAYRDRGGGDYGLDYDALDRLVARRVISGTPDVLNRYGYDNLSRMTCAGIPSDGDSNCFTVNGRITRTYDALGRMRTETNPWGTMTLSYDAAGRRTRMEWPSNEFAVNYGYSWTDDLTSMRRGSNSEVIAAYSYDVLANRLSVVRGASRANSTYVYDAASRLVGLSLTFPDATRNQTYAYSYNPAGQMITAVGSNPLYDFTDGTSGVTTYQNNALNQTTQAGGATQTWLNGNLTSDGTATFTYDQTQRLRTSNLGPSSELTYDALGRMVEMTGTQPAKFRYVGTELVAVTPGTQTTLKWQVMGPIQDELVASWQNGATDVFYSVQDHQNSLVALAPTASLVSQGYGVTINRYDEYGRPEVQGNGALLGGRYGYTGQLWMPDFQAWNYKTRAYRPQLGKFMQTDTVGYQAGMNLYAYVGADPVNMIDPWGKQQDWTPVDDVEFTGKRCAIGWFCWRFAGLSGRIATPMLFFHNRSARFDSLPRCPTNPNLIYSSYQGGYGGSAVSGMRGAKASAAAGVSVPQTGINGAQLYLRTQAGAGYGLGASASTGPTAGVGAKRGPLTPGMSQEGSAFTDVNFSGGSLSYSTNGTPQVGTDADVSAAALQGRAGPGQGASILTGAQTETTIATPPLLCER